MFRPSHAGWIMLIIVNALLWLAFAGTLPVNAEQRRGSTPNANPAAQRAEMVRELSEIKRLLQEQNQILRSGKIKVVVNDS